MGNIIGSGYIQCPCTPLVKTHFQIVNKIDKKKASYLYFIFDSYYQSSVCLIACSSVMAFDVSMKGK